MYISIGNDVISFSYIVRLFHKIIKYFKSNQIWENSKCPKSIILVIALVITATCETQIHQHMLLFEHHKSEINEDKATVQYNNKSAIK